MNKLKIGIIFGGASREREVSFAGGRTVYDNLNKTLFEPIPLFIDSFNNIILLSWEYVYKGSIRDFYPPSELLPASANEFQVYAESLGGLDTAAQLRLINRIGSKVELSALSSLIDAAFLCLHGADGEDGRMQGLLEFLRIPYTGSGILSSSIGMNKAIQKQMMHLAGFNIPRFITIDRNEWIKKSSVSNWLSLVEEKIGLPCVVKSANQGSSIGVSVLQTVNKNEFTNAINRSFFIRIIKAAEWEGMNFESRVKYVCDLCDIREGIGIPVKIGNRIVYHPEELLSVLIHLFAEQENEIMLESVEGESTVLIEEFITGKEFSCIVIEDENGNPLALPPTEIRKGKELFDYRSKYLPGLSRKITPIQLDDDGINIIRTACQKLFTALSFNVYARLDGFITEEGKIFLNDPNTTSGMMPSSFFFHQAAEIGLNPSQFITYIIRTSLFARIKDVKQYHKIPALLSQLENNMQEQKSQLSDKIKIAVILGGYSSERHISVESGRNIYEKLSSSDKYQPVPVFLAGNAKEHQLYRIPINVLLKDNADDILEKIEHFKVHPVIADIILKAKPITDKYAGADHLETPVTISYQHLAELVDGVFIALHGRPGEDGAVQEQLQQVGLPYNGSGPESSQLTIDKFKTNELLREHGFNVAHHKLVTLDDWQKDQQAFYENVKRDFHFPFIAKPVDDGCSSAVKIIHNDAELKAYTDLAFRNSDELNSEAASILHIKPKEEFPRKRTILLEELITAKGAHRFIEITGGLLTVMNERGQMQYEVFEASETLSEGDILSLEEKFLAGQGQNITPARYHSNAAKDKIVSAQVKLVFEKAAQLLNIEGYARIDAFVRIFDDAQAEVIFIEVNSLPGMTPATCIFHQAAIAHYTPYEFIDRILDYGFRKKLSSQQVLN